VIPSGTIPTYRSRNVYGPTEWRASHQAPLLPKSLGPRGSFILNGHNLALEDASSGIEEFDRSGAALASGLDNDVPVTVDKLPTFDLRELSAYQTDGHPLSKQAHAGFFDAYLRLVAPLRRRTDCASGQQQAR
jgi:hypothetical protein